MPAEFLVFEDKVDSLVKYDVRDDCVSVRSDINVVNQLNCLAEEGELVSCVMFEGHVFGCAVHHRFET